MSRAADLIEAQVLGAGLSDQRDLDEVIDTTTPDDFTGWHRPARVTMEDLRSDGEAVDTITLTARLGMQYAADVANLVTTSLTGHVGARIRELKRLARERRMGALIAKIEDMRNAGAPLDEILEVAETGLSAIRSDQALSYQDAQAFAKTIQAEMDRIAAGDGAPISTGFERLDYHTDGGFRPGEYVIIGARPSIGKTAFGIGTSRNMTNAGTTIGFVSLEMDVAAIGLRYASMSTGVPFSEIRSGAINSLARGRIGQWLDKLRGHGFLIVNPHSATFSDIRAIIRTMVRREGARVIFLDYLSLIRAPGDRRPRHEIVAEWSGSLKALASELQIAIVTLVQINRAGEGTQPTLANLRESGSIEQDADIVLLLHRDRGSTDAELIIAKNRNGRLGTVRLYFEAPTVSFREAFFRNPSREASDADF